MSVIEMKVPTVGESISEVTIANWLKATGTYVNQDEVICELESDKATFEVIAEKSGVLTVKAQVGDVLPIGGLICTIDTAVAAPAGAPAKAETATVAASAPVAKAESAPNYAANHPSPAAGKILAEKGIDPAAVNGSGPGGRITKEDALNVNKATSSPAPSAAPAATAPVLGARNVRREKMTSLRKTVSKRLVSVKNETAMLTTFNEVDMKPIMDLRSKYKDQFKEKYGVGLGFMSFFTKACAKALLEFPAVNAYIDGEEIGYNDYCDISIAVSAPKGLVVPVVRNAETLSFDQIEKAIGALAVKARDNKLSMEEMQGGTFTITNGGVFGSMLSTPIINPPQSAILGMHNIVERPVAINGQVEIRPIMYVALSYDHRIIDGKESVSFLVKVKQYLEDPARLLLGV
jgi:2-oxoglutarate dehydrogenase E2 component (dihydrolipoamide succinyltransferase)